MKTVVFIIISLVVGLKLFSQPAIYLKQAAQCPDGSYPIDYDKNGDPICKAEPTGCVHGDSLDKGTCEKFEAIEEPVVNVYQPIEGK